MRGRSSRACLLTDGRRYAWRYALAFVFMFLVAASTSLSAYLMKDVVNKIFVEGREGAIWVLGGVLIALATIKGFSAYGQAVTLGRIGNRIIAGYQKRLYDNLLAQGISFFSDRHSAEFLNRLNSGAGRRPRHSRDSDHDDRPRSSVARLASSR